MNELKGCPRAPRKRAGGAAGAVLGWVTALCLACSGCALTSGGQASPGQASPSATPARESTSPGTASPLPAVGGASRESRPLSCPARVFARMTAAQRVGQLFLVGIAGDPAEVSRAVTAYHFGSLMFGATTTAGVAAVRQLTRADQSLASARATARIRFFIAADQEGGEVQRLRGPGFAVMPTALAQGQLSPRTLQRLAVAWGSELRSAGVNLDLAPVMDVVPPGTAAQNPPIGALQREFGDNPGTVAAHGTAFVRGMRQAGIATTAKHFPGLGRVRENTDFAAGVVDTVTVPGDPYLGSFRAAIGAGVPFVMIALASYLRIDPRHVAAFSTRVMRTMLRQQLRFRGVIVSDDMGAAAAVAGLSPAARATGFLAAGGDMVLSESLPAAAAMAAAVLTRVNHVAAFRSEVNSAVMRILAAKQAYGLLPC